MPDTTYTPGMREDSEISFHCSTKRYLFSSYSLRSQKSSPPGASRESLRVLAQKQERYKTKSDWLATIGVDLKDHPFSETESQCRGEFTEKEEDAPHIQRGRYSLGNAGRHRKETTMKARRKKSKFIQNAL